MGIEDKQSRDNLSDVKERDQGSQKFRIDQPGVRSGSKAGQSGSQAVDEIDDGDADGVGAETDEKS